jgi:hypothetical protein
MQAMKWTHCLLSLVGCLVLAESARAGPIVPYDPLIVGFDFNGDGKGDIIRDAGAGGIRIDILDGTSSVANGTLPTAGGSFVLKAVGHFNADAQADTAVQGNGTVRVSFTAASGTATTGTPIFVPDGGGTWQLVDAADVNHDGIDELIFVGTGAATGAVRIADISTGTPTYTFLSTAGGIWQYVFAADVNGDGNRDLVFDGTGAAAGTARANLSGGTTTVFYAQGGGAWVLKASGDFNSDGVDDLADTGTGAANGFDRIRLLDHTGNPTSQGFLSNGGGSFEIRAVADFNSDSKADLAYHGPVSDRVTILNGSTVLSQYFPANAGGTFQLRYAPDPFGSGYPSLVAVDGSSYVRIQIQDGTAVTGSPVFLGPNGSLFHPGLSTGAFGPP